jgi:hypothetical protein
MGQATMVKVSKTFGQATMVKVSETFGQATMVKVSETFGQATMVKVSGGSESTLVTENLLTFLWSVKGHNLAVVTEMGLTSQSENLFPFS